MPPALARGWLRRLLLALVALALLLPVMLLCMWAGEIRMPAGTIGDVLANHLLGAGIEVDPIDDGIVWNYRLTRAIVAACCGAGLAVSGVVLQTLLRNTLADPYLLGISAGASTGAVLVAVAGVGGGVVSMTVGAFGGAVTAFALVALLAQAAGGGGLRNSGQIILAGIAGSQLFNALTSLIITKSGSAEQARGIMFWLLGSLMARSRWLHRWLSPVLDIIQTMPSFVYLIPVLMLFGIGRIPALFATVVYATAPLVRLTALGIREVDARMVESAESFGCTRTQLLFWVILAIVIDRITQAYGRRGNR